MDAEESFILDVTSHDGTFDSDFLERLGHPVLVCHGPDWSYNRMLWMTGSG
jgi:hypothetical protein